MIFGLGRNEATGGIVDAAFNQKDYLRLLKGKMVKWHSMAIQKRSLPEGLWIEWTFLVRDRLLPPLSFRQV